MRGNNINHALINVLVLIRDVFRFKLAKLSKCKMENCTVYVFE